MGDPKPPVPMRVKSFEGFTRLSLALTESPPLLWQFRHDGKRYLATFTVYMSWKGDVPLFAYIPLRRSAGPFLAYRSDGDREECIFTDNIEDTKYFYAPIINLREPPSIFKRAISGKSSLTNKPLGIQLDNLHSIMRLLYLISAKEFTSFPVWSFKKEGKCILGVCVPFEHYYEANALPVFFYVKIRRQPNGHFIRYSTSRMGGEALTYSKTASDTKYFYAKIIDVEDMPLFHK